MILNTTNKKEMLRQVKSLISRAESYTSPNRLSRPLMKELLNLGTDNPNPKDIKLKESSFATLRLDHKKKEILHIPFVAALIKRAVGKHAKARKQFVIKSYDNESLEYKKATKLARLSAMMDKFAEEKNEERAKEIQEEMVNLAESDIQTQAEKDASLAIEMYSDTMQKEMVYEKALYQQKITGEIFLTQDMFEYTAKPRACKSLDIYFLPGSRPFDISTSPLISEDIFLDVHTIIDRMDLSSATIEKLLEHESSHKANSNSTAATGELHGMNKVHQASWSKLKNRFSYIHDLETDAKADYDPASGLYKMQKLTAKTLKKRKKLFETIIDEEEQNYKLVSNKREILDGQESKNTYTTAWYVAYYIPVIDEIVFWKEIRNVDVTEGKSDNDNNLYSGFIDSIDGETPFSDLNNIKHLIYERDGLYDNINTLIADNLGKILVSEYLSKPDSISYAEMLTLLKVNKMIRVDSSRKVVSDTHQPDTYLGNVTKGKMVDTVDLDNSENIMRIMNTIRGIEQAIDKGDGTTDESRGDIGQNSSISNVNYAVQQSVDVNTPALKMYYAAFAQLLQIIIETLRFKNKGRKLKLSELTGNYVRRAEIEIGADSLSNAQLGIEIVVDTEEIALVDHLKKIAADIMHQKGLTYREYVELYRLDSVNAIIKVLDEAEDKRNKQAQEAQNAQMKAMQAEKAAESAETVGIEQGKQATDVKVANIRKDAVVEVAEIKAASDAESCTRDINKPNKSDGGK